MSLPITAPTSTLRDSVAQDLRERIEGCELPPGSRLPSYTALAARYGVSDITVRAAMRSLMDHGLVRSRRGSGLYVCDPLPGVRTPSEASRGLMSDVICVLTQHRGPFPGSESQQGYSYYIAHSAVQAIRSRDLHTMELNPRKFWTPTGVLNNEEAEHLLALRPRGVIITAYNVPWPRLHASMLAALEDAGVHVVVYGSMPELARHDCVVSDHEQGAYELTQFLIARGRRRIGFAFHPRPNTYWYDRRRRGYEKALIEAGLEPLPTIELPIEFDTGGTPEAFKRGSRFYAGYLAEYLTGSGPLDGLLLPSDGSVFPAAAACRLLARQPQVDIDLVGYDNYWQDAPDRKYERVVPLASVDKLNVEAGRALVDLLLERSSGQLPAEPQRRVITPKLALAADYA